MASINRRLDQRPLCSKSLALACQGRLRDEQLTRTMPLTAAEIQTVLDTWPEDDASPGKIALFRQNDPPQKKMPHPLPPQKIHKHPRHEKMSSYLKTRHAPLVLLPRCLAR
jgi:hypothetical protein